MNANPRSIAVLGGGISGLTCALRLVQAGHRVVLIEASEQLGGLGTFFEHEGRTFEKFYHCMLPSDEPLLKVLETLGIRDEVYWKPTTFAYAHQGRIFPLNSAFDLLKFAPLRIIDRIRVGITGLYGRLISDKGLDNVTTVKWLTRLSGARAFAKFWQPMLEAKFGDRYHDVPALWFWTRFNREKGESKGECKGYIKGGYKHITDTFARVLRVLGCEIRLNTAVQAVDLDAEGRATVTTAAGSESFDQLVITLPPPQVEQLIGPAMRREMPQLDTTTDYQGVINCLLFLKKPLTPHYWVATPGNEHPFDGVVETSTLTDTADRGRRHVVYLTKYLHRSDERFSASDACISACWVPALQKLFPQLQDSDIESVRVFRSPFVEPIYKLGQLQLRPPEELVRGKVYLASTAQVYPVVTSWNGSVIQAGLTLASMGIGSSVRSQGESTTIGSRTAALKLTKPHDRVQALRPAAAKV
ncbi:MAG: NAD(P)/FAD-dependent oxidoreductase [Prosthecobacter sp.]|uniref:NAD(P)/FAD-dependent oxidoreductase n=1 Tax=Prosthecobacter sp. TaxID=1965333 RepID=UPI0025DAB026|nr:NAD(P)/FAD-dependent oxidoreductase [Prosthecobacter sp.]MCF7787846.1 NAD(P)/FAD-dependent oxidoreductase [Prosthecobacter sp.]